MTSKYYKHQLSNGKSFAFFYNPINQSSSCHLPKAVNPNLTKILLNPEKYQALHPSQIEDKIFLGFASINPHTTNRFPIWIEPDLITKHILIGGSIGSGKTTLTNRLLAGALNTYGTVIIGEAKGVIEGNPDGSAFAKLANYLSQRLKVKYYRWTRGNCYFNPLIYLNNTTARKTFMQTLACQVKAEGEVEAYINRAADIATYILEYLETVSVKPEIRKKICTLRNLLFYLKHPEKVENAIKKDLEQFQNPQIKSKISNLRNDLERLNFFSLNTPAGRDRFVMTANGINFFANLIDEEDLLYYSEPHDQDRNGQPLVELTIQDILYDRSLVVISQPLALDHPSSKIAGVIFWDTLLNHALKLGTKPELINGKKREKVAIFLDETHRLPTGKLGNSGDFLREYNLGIIEITPTIVDHERWEQNKHVYQTIISTSPGVPEVVNLIHERLPEYIKEPFEIGISVNLNQDNTMRVAPFLRDNRTENLNQNNPGVSLRSLQDTGTYTAILYTKTIRDGNGIFWLDLESSILANINYLLEDALKGDQVAGKIIDYGLGLTQKFIT